MNAIPHSNYRAVVFTKEQYARTPLRDDTVDEHAQDMLYDFVAAGRVASAMDSDSHRKEAARRRVLSEYSDTGTEKAEKYPYFEDMGFDSVIADEGHNYRNSYKNGREASQLAYLPTSAVAQSARDMAIKNAYLMKKNGGRGPVLLTATPVVNTPIDAYNMLSHVLPKEYWQKMGIYGPDDFVKFFGKTRLETVQKISGEVEEKMALVGFENLDALRGIFHRWTTLKTAEDVKDTVEIPELDEHQQDAPLTEEQLAAYEELRQQAEAVAKANNGVTTSVDEDGVIEHEKARPIFSIIRDMDRVCTDMDLYYRRITYRFLPEYADAVQQLADSLPKQATSEDDDSDDSITQQSQYSLIDKGEFIQLQVPEAFEQEVNKRLARFGIDEQTVTHPVTPKYAKLIATLKEFFPEGKQIIFTDEKTQHQKLKRIICNALNLEPSKVRILNAQTVAEAGKTGKKLKAVKPPKELPDEPTDAQIAKYNEQMALYDAYIAQQNEMSLGGLEKIAADFQEGRTPIIICNKKAEVGINLHRGTTDIHHLTLPWTPASVAQRNGRGARVGSNRASVRVHYYCGKGSFDEYRLKTLKRKAGWISDILRSDKSEMENADANDMIEMQMYTAKDDGERLAMMQVQMDKAKAAQRARQKEQAAIDLQNYIKAQHAAGEDVAALTAELERSKAELEKTTAEVAKFKQAVMAKAADNADWKARWGSVHHTDRTLLAHYRASLKSAIQRKANITQAISRYEKLLNRTQKAATDIKRLRPLVEDAINKGILDVDPDLVNHANEFLVIAAERKANLNHAVAALTQSWVTAIREVATTGKITPAIADVVNDGSKFMDAYQMDAVQLPSAYGQLSYRMTYNLVSMFSDLAILGLVDLNEVTPELLSMRKNHVEILQRINTVLAGRTDEEKQADADRINLALGNITEEEIAARNEKQEELSSIQGDATSIAQSLGLNYRVSTADLKMMYAPKFAAGEVFGLQEASGMKGVLFRAKDAIKKKFGARWLPAKAKNSDFPGNWWIIETKHNVADVLAVIQQYA
ncbi:helicase-related protein [Escherichia coli]|uniref:helicase-related protein n=1 Tax=Escherichia coli TaxID=562 RepID=UPI00214936C6|nr:helicase-related protein [Escherichia coli]MCR1079609.1 helicase [Escherichia coli]